MNLREYQKKAVEWAKTSDGLIISPAGSGKTWIAASIIKNEQNGGSGLRFGWLAPTRETCQQARTSLRVAGVSDEIVDIRCPHESVDFSKKDMLIVDECFPSWIKIGDKPISQINAGDMVDSYNHELKCVEKRRVLEVFKTPMPNTMVTVWTEDGSTTCTPGHPFWNGFEYVPAISLTSDDVVAIIPSHEHGMQRMRGSNRKERAFLDNQKAGLRAMQSTSQIREQETGGNSMCMVQYASHMHGEKTCPQESGCRQTGKGILLDSMSGLDGFKNEFGNHVGHQQADGRQDFQVDVSQKCFRSDKKTSVGISQTNRTQTEVSWREWNRSNINSAYALAHVQPFDGTSNQDCWKRNAECSELLQSGPSGTISEAGDRGRWQFAQFDQQEGCGQKENRNTQLTRVVRVEIHKQGSASWSRAMRGEDQVYNFSVEGNENYFANGILVHNCKHAPAAGWRRIIESCSGLRFGFDATPWGDDEDRNAVTRTLFRNRTYEIKRSDIGDSLADAYLHLSDATDLNLKQKIDDNIDRLFQARRRYMRISDDELKRMCAWESLVDIGICQNRDRNAYAVDYALEHMDMQTLILIPRITLGEQYEAAIPRSLLVHSKIGKKQRKAAMEEFKAGNLRTMIATSLADEGLDLPNVELLIMVSGGRSSQKTIQRASRALRKTDSKNCATILDFSDRFHPIGAYHSKKRMACYRELGCVFLQ
jgi:superfamily II DNA or RNA helicase